MEVEPLAVNTSCHAVIYGSDVKVLVKILQLHLAVRACRLKTYLWTGGERGGAKAWLERFFLVQIYEVERKGTKDVYFLERPEVKVSTWSYSEHLGPPDMSCHIPATCPATS